MRKHFLPFSLPDLDQNELDEIKEVLESHWITTGPKAHQFETQFAAAVGARFAVAVNSCTAALHLALEAVGVQKASVVLTAPYTFAASAEVIRYFDAIPLFVDIDPITLNLDASRLSETLEAITLGRATLARVAPALPPEAARNLKAVIPVHMAGLAADMDAIASIALQHGLSVVEDAAHAFPARYKDRPIGSAPLDGVRSATCFSFYATKTITTAEGGMICTDDPELAERCRIMSLHGISKDAWNRYSAQGNWYYEIIAPGYKYNMTDIAAAMGLAQLHKAERMRDRRREIAKKYNEAFEPVAELQIPAEFPWCHHAWHLYVLRLHLERLTIDRSQFIAQLRQSNIGTSVHFIPLHLHPYYRDTYGYEPEDFPVAYREYQRVISLPLYSKMTDQDAQDVIDAVADIVERFRR